MVKNGLNLRFSIKSTFLPGRFRSEPAAATRPADQPPAAAADRGLGRLGMDLVKFGEAEAGLIRQKYPITNLSQ